MPGKVSSSGGRGNLELGSEVNDLLCKGDNLCLCPDPGSGWGEGSCPSFSSVNAQMA